jgi:hypothetical protein
MGANAPVGLFGFRGGKLERRVPMLTRLGEHESVAPGCAGLRRDSLPTIRDNVRMIKTDLENSPFWWVEGVPAGFDSVRRRGNCH